MSAPKHGVVANKVFSNSRSSPVSAKADAVVALANGRTEEGIAGHHLTELFDANHLGDTIERVVLRRGARAWVRLPEGGKIHLARVEVDGEVVLHVMIAK